MEDYLPVVVYRPSGVIVPAITGRGCYLYQHKHCQSIVKLAFSNRRMRLLQRGLLSQRKSYQPAQKAVSTTLHGNQSLYNLQEVGGKATFSALVRYNFQSGDQEL